MLLGSNRELVVRDVIPERCDLADFGVPDAPVISEVVKVPAHAAPSGASSRERSGLPEAFRPAVTAAAWKPRGAVMPPGMGCQGWVTVGAELKPSSPCSRIDAAAASLEANDSPGAGVRDGHRRADPG